MCGVAGIMSEGGSLDFRVELDQMVRSLAHRGPDDSGIWFEEQDGIGLGHTRLSIVDLSSMGHQPMISESGRFVISYNGEIYNAPDIRESLGRGESSFRGHSDTEVLLAAIEKWGLRESLARCIGMFAFSLWDRQDRQLTLARDRLGIKPLYYGWAGDKFVFASELKAIQALTGWRGSIDKTVLHKYFRFGVIADPDCIFDGIYKLPAGSTLCVDLQSSKRSHTPHADSGSFCPKTYWRASDYMPEPASQNTGKVSCLASSKEQLEELLADSVKRRMVADVDVGAFLSGGIDSSLVVALMAANTSSVRTFTIGFGEDAYNEADYAREIASRLGTQHTQVMLSSQDALDLVPKMTATFDEPFADSSQLPTYLVSELARRDVTVALSGDGGDELFFGYDRYRKLTRQWSQLRYVPASIAGLVKHAVGFSLFGAEGRLARVAALSESSNYREFYENSFSQWQRTDLLLPGIQAAADLPWDGFSATIDEYMMLHDTCQYLPGDILTKVDRVSMAQSLEVRVPLLDHRVVEFARRLPISLKRDDESDKLLLRSILSNYLPTELFDRPKQGFGIPLAAWMRGPLSSWAERLLDKALLADQGILDVERVWSRWQAVKSGSNYGVGGLWSVLVFQDWLVSAVDSGKLHLESCSS